MSRLEGSVWLRLVPVLLLGASSATPARGAEKVSFNRDVRPILTENCLACHGFDAKHREAGLRLDTFEGATVDHDGATAIAPGDLENSELWFRITSDDPDLLMPVVDAHKALIATTVARA